MAYTIISSRRAIRSIQYHSFSVEEGIPNRATCVVSFFCAVVSFSESSHYENVSVQKSMEIY